MSEEKRMIGSYEVEHSIHLGDKEVVLGVDKKEQYPFMVCYCTYNNPLAFRGQRKPSARTIIWKPCRYSLTECRHRWSFPEPSLQNIPLTRPFSP